MGSFWGLESFWATVAVALHGWAETLRLVVILVTLVVIARRR